VIAQALDAHFRADERRLFVDADDAEVIGQRGRGIEADSIVLDQQL
jgi:hypothetical protein